MLVRCPETNSRDTSAQLGAKARPVLSSGVVIAAGLAWLGLLFAAALYGERRPRVFERHWAIVYALSLAVYCTSWTFFGTVTQAARYDWPLPPTFVGTIALYVFGIGFLLRLVRLVREHNSTSLADFIATRLGKDGWLAAAVTFVAVLGIVPYIALQLKAVAMSFALLVRDDPLQVPAWQDSALYVALAMAAFAMLFGTRSASAIEHNRGLVLAMAFEARAEAGRDARARCVRDDARPKRPPRSRRRRARKRTRCRVSRRWCCSACWRCSRCRTSSMSARSSAATSATCIARAGCSRCTCC